MTKRYSSFKKSKMESWSYLLIKLAKSLNISVVRLFFLKTSFLIHLFIFYFILFLFFLTCVGESCHPSATLPQTFFLIKMLLILYEITFSN